MTSSELENHTALNIRVTRKDIARAAGVSVTAVSNALNDTPNARIGARTREKIRRVAGELGYRNSFAGKALMQGKTFTVGLILPQISSLSYRYYHQILENMIDEMEKEDYHLLFLFQSEDKRYLKPITEGRVDGVIFLETDIGDTHIKTVEETGIPMVVLNRTYDPTTDSRCGNIHSAHEAVLEAAVDELVEAGRQSLIWINRCPEINQPRNALNEGFRQALFKRLDDGVIGTTFLADDNNFPKQIRTLLKSGQHYPGAIINGADLTGMYVEAAEEFGLKIGTDYDVITTTNMYAEVSTQCQERATYTQNPGLLGRHGWYMLKKLIAGHDTEKIEVLPYERFAVRGNPTDHLIQFPQ